MKESQSFSFEDALGSAEREAREHRIEFYREEIGKFLDPPYIFAIPKTKDRLKDRYPDNYYMCRNGNRTAVAGFMEELLDDPTLQLSAEQRLVLQGKHDFIIGLPRDTWRTEEEMRQIKFAIEESVRIIGALSEHAHDQGQDPEVLGMAA